MIEIRTRKSRNAILLRGLAVFGGTCLLEHWNQRDIDVRVGEVGLEGVAAVLAHLDLREIVCTVKKTLT